jgi:ribosomal protein S18 acetylase RimI-like enzyme
VTIRAGRSSDTDAIQELYQTVARVSGGLAHDPDEISAAYIRGFVDRSLADGVLLVAEVAGRPGLAGELHTYTNGLRRFNHVLSSLTVAVHPETQGRGIGRRLFEALLAEVRVHRPAITRIELFTQESNTRAQQLYRSVGFRHQGRFEEGIRNANGGLETDLPMAWLRSSEAVPDAG